jgi:hypothetical protein
LNQNLHMKTNTYLSLLLFCVLFICGSGMQQAYASHIIGSDITYKCTTTPGIFEVTLILFRKCDAGSVPLCPDSCGASCQQNLTLSGADPNCSSSNFTSINLSLVSVRDININDNCPASKNTCTNMGCVTAGTYTPGIERYEFVGMVNIGPTSGIPASCCNVRIAYSFCCRNMDINTGAAGQNFYVDAIINRCLSVSPCNSSPVLTNDPYAVICGGHNYVFNNGAVDPDLDSLSFAFTPALIGAGSSVTYEAPFAYNKPMPWTGSATGTFPAGIHCDPFNGDIQFTPPNASAQFSGVVAIEIKQWKQVNGVMTVVGITRRDIQMMVRNDCLPNNPPRLITSPPLDGNDFIPKTNWEICAGEKFCFTVTAKDTDFNLPTLSDTTYLTWNATLAKFGATFVPDYDPTKRRLPDSLGGGPREDRYRFCWTPSNNMVSSIPYYFTIAAKDTRCPNPGRATLSFAIKVSPKPSVSIQKNIDSCGRLHLAFTNNNPSVPIGQYAWEVQLHENPSTRKTYANNNPAIHLIKDTGRYEIKLELFPGTASNLSCSAVAFDSIDATSTSLYDSVVLHQPTCHYSTDGSIEAFGKNGILPYQFALNNEPYGTNAVFTGLAIGSYVIHIKDASGCKIMHEVHLERPSLLPNGIGGLQYVNVGDSAIYKCHLEPGQTALWNSVNGMILSGQNTGVIWVKWNTAGTGEVNVIVSDSLCSETDKVNITIGNVGLPKLSNPLGIQLYPNPTQSILQITSRFIRPDMQIEVYNSMGKLVLEKPFSTQQQLDLTLLPVGLYIVKIGDWHQQVVKE